MYPFLKRLFDIAASLFVVVIISPLLFSITLLLLIFNKGEVLYLQQRIGFKNKPFGIYKFSTMLKDSPNMAGGNITLRNDPRVTKIGRILRITKLNELPQLFNVFFGQMSFVGPRPLMSKGFDLFSEDVQEFLYLSKPGITGISSVVFRDEERLVTDSGMVPFEFYKLYIFPYKDQLERWYFKNKSFAVDISILILTAFKIIAPATKLEFKIFPSLPKSDFFKF